MVTQEQWDWQHAMEAQRQDQQIAAQAEHADFARRVTASRNAGANVAALLAEARATMPSWDSYYREKAAQEQAAAEEAERQRIAALTPKEIWMSTLQSAERAHINRWESINKAPWPYAPV